MSAAPSSKILNEQLAKTFGYQINLEKFTDAHLDDARNKLRTKLSQYEISEGYSAILENPDYQKTKMLLDVINTEIFEREGREEIPVDDINAKFENLEDKLKYQKIRSRAYEHAVPDAWIESAINRIKLGESDRSELSAELKLRYDLNESEASWILLESEEMRAEIIMASKDMIDRITGWYEDVAAMKSEQFLELVDTISELLGNDTAQSFVGVVKPALDTIYNTLESVRASLSQGLDILTGDMPATMGDNAESSTTSLPGSDTALPTTTPAAPSAQTLATMPAEPEEDAGRIKRESVDYGRRLGLMLSSSKKNSMKV